MKDAHDYYRSCGVCQAYAQRSTVSGPLHPIPPLGPFEKWGINLMGPLAMTKRGHRFIVVITNYFTKFVEVRALKSSVKHEITRFYMNESLFNLGHHLKLFLILIPSF